MAYKRTQEALGVNPNPHIWIDVKTKEGWYRKQKPKVKPKLNAIMQQHADAQAVTMPATKRILDRLQEWTRGFELGRINATINSRLKRSYLEDGKISFKYLLGLDLQPKRTLRRLLDAIPYAKVTDEIAIKVWGSNETIRVQRSIYTDYYYELIMVWGDPMKEKGLRVDSVESPVYPKEIEEPKTYLLKIEVPTTKQPWMALLRVACMEGNEMAYHPRHYAMKVMAVGE